MIGAIAGDIIGSVYEWDRIKTTDFPLFSARCTFTDDTVLTVAVADVLLHGRSYAEVFKEYFLMYPDAGWGGRFRQWAASDRSSPYQSFGNGSAMRVSAVGFAFSTLDETLQEAERSAAATHNHPEGIKGACATAGSIFMARSGFGRDEIRRFVADRYRYDLDRSVDAIRPSYGFDETCQRTVPEAIICFLESKDYEDAVRLAVSLGGDSDTLACITGGIAEAYYGVPDEITEQALGKLDERLREVVVEFRDTHHL